MSKFPTSKDIYLEADGVKVAVVQSYTAKATKSSSAMEAFGEAEPVATVPGQERHVVELKIWGGRAYHEEGERQLIGYLDSYHLNRGYMLTYNFNQNKKPGVEEVRIGDKVLFEAMV